MSRSQVNNAVFTATVLLLTGAVAIGQPADIIRYDFNAGDATNSAVPGVGNGTPDPSLIFGAAGPLCSGDGDCSSAAAVATTQIDTGWATTLGASDWTIGMHLDLTAGGGFLNYFQYMFGDSTAASFRCFVDGAAGNGNIILRGGGLTDVIITGGGNQTVPVHVAWVYDSTVPEVRGYLDGVLNVTVPQAALNINGTGATNFTVMRYNASASSARPGVRMDDFRVYGRAVNMIDLQGWIGCSGSGMGAFANFTGSPLSGPGPLTVNFTDASFTSNPPILTWAWDFGDGNNSTMQNPTHTYTCPGSYDVSLMVNDGVNPPHATTKTAYVTVDAPAFAMSTTGGGVGDLTIMPVPSNPCFPGAIVGYTLASLQTTAGTIGNGPFFGINPDVLTITLIVAAPTVGYPPHFIITPTTYPNAGPMAYPAPFFAPLAGVTMDACQIMFDVGGNLVLVSNVAQVTF